MDRSEKRKLAAVMAALLHHEAEAAAAAAVPAFPEEALPPPLPFLSVWSMAGRRDMMGMRSLWQLRTGRG